MGLALGHKIDKIKSFPLIISDDIESVAQTSKLIKILENLNLIQDVKRLENRKRRSGKVVLRGRTTKIGKSVLFVLGDSKNVKNACRGIPVDFHPKFKKKRALEVVLTTLHSGGKFNDKKY